MPSPDKNAHLEEIRTMLRRLKGLLARSHSKQVQAASIVDAAKRAVGQYFKAARPAFREHGLDEESLAGLDKWMQELLALTQRAARKTAYEQAAKAVNQELNGVEIALVTALPANGQDIAARLDGKEARIASTLSDLVPSAGLSYEQACKDIRDVTRQSFRGAASELRESLREVLDHLAPDETVKAQPNFCLEKDQKRPTMKQKMRFILASRGKGKTLTAVPENAVGVIEERVATLARSLYERSSVSTHIGGTKQEVQQIKAYVDVVLGELLEIA
jgi:hypothetical protein